MGRKVQYKPIDGMGKLWNRYKILGTNKYVYYIIKKK